MSSACPFFLFWSFLLFMAYTSMLSYCLINSYYWILKNYPQIGNCSRIIYYCKHLKMLIFRTCRRRTCGQPSAAAQKSYWNTNLMPNWQRRWPVRIRANVLTLCRLESFLKMPPAPNQYLNSHQVASETSNKREFQQMRLSILVKTITTLEVNVSNEF